MNKNIHVSLACLAIASISIAASSSSLKPLTLKRVAELTAPSDTPDPKRFTISVYGLEIPSSPPLSTAPPKGTPAKLDPARVTLAADKPQGGIEFIREVRFPTQFAPPQAAKGENDSVKIAAPTTPLAFETVNTGWTIHLTARPVGRLVELYGVVDYVAAELIPGGYGPLSGPIYDGGHLLSPNVVTLPKFETTTTRFHIFAVPGEPCDVVLYQGKKSEKHRVTVDVE